MLKHNMAKMVFTELRNLWSRNVYEITYVAQIIHKCFQITYDMTHKIEAVLLFYIQSNKCKFCDNTMLNENKINKQYSNVLLVVVAYN